MATDALHPSERLHGLDNLRAIMMWLGIVLHVLVNHLSVKSVLPWHDRLGSPVVDLMFVFIHAFRMPVFFMLAGFFVAMLVLRRGYGGMLSHRLRRIGLPFLIFWPLIFISTVVLVMEYVHVMATGRFGLDKTLMVAAPGQPTINTLHLWFMYYLLWFSLLTALCGWLGGFLSAPARTAIARFWVTLASSWWGFLILAAPLALIGAPHAGGLLPPSSSFIPTVSETVQGGLFFLIGWHLFQQRADLLPRYAKLCWRYAAAGLVFFMLYLTLANPRAGLAGKIAFFPCLLAFAYNCCSWLWSFALLGMVLRYLPAQNRFLRYLSDSSYWMYLVHMLGTIGFGVLLYDAPFNLAEKIILNIGATTLFCLASYHLLVRSSVIGRLLNGRRPVQPAGPQPEDELVLPY